MSEPKVDIRKQGDSYIARCLFPSCGEEFPGDTRQQAENVFDDHYYAVNHHLAEDESEGY